MDPGNFPGNPVVKTSPFNAGGPGSILGWGAKIPHVLQPRKKKPNQTKTIKQKQYCNKFNKSFKKKKKKQVHYSVWNSSLDRAFWPGPKRTADQLR